jgi:hypothetical protein
MCVKVGDAVLDLCNPSDQQRLKVLLRPCSQLWKRTAALAKIDAEQLLAMRRAA